MNKSSSLLKLWSISEVLLPFLAVFYLQININTSLQLKLHMVNNNLKVHKDAHLNLLELTAKNCPDHIPNRRREWKPSRITHTTTDVRCVHLDPHIPPPLAILSPNVEIFGSYQYITRK